MPVQMIQSDVSRSNVCQDALKISALRTPSIKGGVGRLDSYKPADSSLAKFVIQPARYLAQAGAAKAQRLSYQTVSNRLTSRKGIFLSAYKRNLVKKSAAVVPVLLKALKHKNKSVRLGAVDVLGRIFQGTGTSTTWKAVLCKLVVVPRLTAALKDKDAKVRKATKKAIDAIKGKKTVYVIHQ